MFFMICSFRRKPRRAVVSSTNSGGFGNAESVSVFVNVQGREVRALRFRGGSANGGVLTKLMPQSTDAISHIMGKKNKISTNPNIRTECGSFFIISSLFYLIIPYCFFKSNYKAVTNSYKIITNADIDFTDKMLYNSRVGSERVCTEA